MNMTIKDNLSTIIFIVLIIICSGGVIAGGVYYLNKDSELRAQIDQRQADLTEMKRKVAMLPQLREECKTGVEEIKRLHRFAPSRQEQAAFILELERIARSCGVDIIRCKMDDRTKRFKTLSTYQVYQWAVELNGEYHGIKRFLEMILDSKRFMMVSSLDMNASEPDAESRKAYELTTQLIIDLIAPVEQGKVSL